MRLVIASHSVAVGSADNRFLIAARGSGKWADTRFFAYAAADAAHTRFCLDCRQAMLMAWSTSEARKGFESA